MRMSSWLTSCACAQEEHSMHSIHSAQNSPRHLRNADVAADSGGVFSGLEIWRQDQAKVAFCRLRGSKFILMATELIAPLIPAMT
jgi:hypothetical protein